MRNLDSSCFPIVIIPNEIAEIIDNGVTKDDVRKFLNLNYLNISLKKIPQKPTEQIIVEEEKLKLTGNGCLLLVSIPTLIFIGALIIGGFQSGRPELSILFVVILIVVLSQLGVRIKTKKQYTTKELSQKAYDAAVEKYNRELEDVVVYNNLQKGNYEREKMRIDGIVEQNFQLVKDKLIKERLSPYTQMKKSQSNLYRGRCEAEFFTHLVKEFGKQIMVDYIVYEDEEENSFQPDFIFVSDRTGLTIDIEIDEPYTANYKSPTHYINSRDEERNFFFEENNWVIVRFSEKQIATEPEKCCTFLANLVSYIESENQMFENNLPLDKIWSRDEAIDMANHNYRNSYLPNHLRIRTEPKKIDFDSDEDYLPF